MDRRDFLKIFGAVGIAIPSLAIPQLPIVKETLAGQEIIKRVDFSRRATLRRYNDKRWILEFASDEALDVKFKDDIVIAIEDNEYILSEITEIQVSTEFLSGWSRIRDSDRDYIHWLTGNKWTEIQ